MRSPFAFLRTLILPWGATTGRRILLDGLNGLIAWYDASGALRGRIGGAAEPASIELFPDDPDLASTAEIVAGVEGAGATRQATLYLFGPTLTGSVGPQPAIRIQSDSRDGTITDFVVITATKVAFEGAQAAAGGPVGSIVGKVAVCDPNSGAVVGFLPVYDTIT